jgi:hypothetical protein
VGGCGCEWQASKCGVWGWLGGAGLMSEVAERVMLHGSVDFETGGSLHGCFSAAQRPFFNARSPNKSTFLLLLGAMTCCQKREKSERLRL